VRLALRQLDEWGKARVRLEDSADQQALHDFRVALRRLRTLVRGFRLPHDPLLPRRLRRRLGRFAEATGEGRDLEVQIEWVRTQLPGLTPRHRSGARWMLSRLEQRQQTAAEELRGVVAERFDPLQDRLRSALADAQSEIDARVGDRHTAGQQVGRVVLRWTANLQSQLDRIRTISDDAPGHAARIAVKRLRYVLEPFQTEVAAIPPVIGRLKELQDLLGDLHDSHRIAAALLQEMRAAADTHTVSTFLKALPWVATRTPAEPGKSRDPRPGLLALAGGLRVRAEALFTTLKHDWLDGGAIHRFGDDLRAIGGAIATPREAGVEIERKFLLTAVPPHALAFPVEEIEQGWLPGSLLVERLRHVHSNGTNEWFRTVKAGRGLRRTEIEEATTPELFAALWPLTEGCRVVKRRYLVPEGTLTWEIDEFLDRPLALAEIELPTENTEVETPAWLAEYIVREVTGEPAYLNRTLAR
jgi:CHAD domain-containing protein/CYTH domain-containing protein